MTEKSAAAQPTPQQINEVVNEQIERAIGQLVLENIQLKARLRLTQNSAAVS